ncbi:MAG: ribosomal-protein-alanine N-acetyltransferase [Dehalococcoidia bacterium]|nr:ribosomal-protein-alanine N-acetyltransferase [Dehalococcoidia bacterium]
MRFSLRPLGHDDIPQVEEVEKSAFPTLWPLTSFERELKNHLACYLIAWEPLQEGIVLPPRPPRRHTWLQQLAGRWGLEAPRPEPLHPPKQRVVGYVGVWFMTDEAHIVSLGTQEEYRRQGIGELLLISSIELAYLHRSRLVTLEVRASNAAAQVLYVKYGFARAGVRRRYYTDNREDAVIMSTPPIDTPEYRAHFVGLVLEHQTRWGACERILQPAASS